MDNKDENIPPAPAQGQSRSSGVMSFFPGLKSMLSPSVRSASSSPSSKQLSKNDESFTLASNRSILGDLNTILSPFKPESSRHPDSKNGVGDKEPEAVVQSLVTDLVSSVPDKSEKKHRVSGISEVSENSFETAVGGDPVGHLPDLVQDFGTSFNSELGSDTDTSAVYESAGEEDNVSLQNRPSSAAALYDTPLDATHVLDSSVESGSTITAFSLESGSTITAFSFACVDGPSDPKTPLKANPALAHLNPELNVSALASNFQDLYLQTPAKSKLVEAANNSVLEISANTESEWLDSDVEVITHCHGRPSDPKIVFEGRTPAKEDPQIVFEGRTPAKEAATARGRPSVYEVPVDEDVLNVLDESEVAHDDKIQLTDEKQLETRTEEEVSETAQNDSVQSEEITLETESDIVRVETISQEGNTYLETEKTKSDVEVEPVTQEAAQVEESTPAEASLTEKVEVGVLETANTVPVEAEVVANVSVGDTVLNSSSNEQAETAVSVIALEDSSAGENAPALERSVQVETETPVPAESDESPVPSPPAADAGSPVELGDFVPVSPPTSPKPEAPVVSASPGNPPVAEKHVEIDLTAVDRQVGSPVEIPEEVEVIEETCEEVASVCPTEEVEKVEEVATAVPFVEVPSVVESSPTVVVEETAEGQAVASEERVTAEGIEEEVSQSVLAEAVGDEVSEVVPAEKADGKVLAAVTTEEVLTVVPAETSQAEVSVAQEVHLEETDGNQVSAVTREEIPEVTRDLAQDSIPATEKVCLEETNEEHLEAVEEIPQARSVELAEVEVPVKEEVRTEEIKEKVLSVEKEIPQPSPAELAEVEVPVKEEVCSERANEYIVSAVEGIPQASPVELAEVPAKEEVCSERANEDTVSAVEEIPQASPVELAEVEVPVKEEVRTEQIKEKVLSVEEEIPQPSPADLAEVEVPVEEEVCSERANEDIVSAVEEIPKASPVELAEIEVPVEEEVRTEEIKKEVPSVEKEIPKAIPVELPEAEVPLTKEVRPVECPSISSALSSPEEVQNITASEADLDETCVLANLGALRQTPRIAALKAKRQSAVGSEPSNTPVFEGGVSLTSTPNENVLDSKLNGTIGLDDRVDGALLDLTVSVSTGSPSVASPVKPLDLSRGSEGPLDLSCTQAALNQTRVIDLSPPKAKSTVPLDQTFQVGDPAFNSTFVKTEHSSDKVNGTFVVPAAEPANATFVSDRSPPEPSLVPSVFSPVPAPAARKVESCVFSPAVPPSAPPSAPASLPAHQISSLSSLIEVCAKQEKDLREEDDLFHGEKEPSPDFDLLSAEAAKVTEEISLSFREADSKNVTVVMADNFDENVNPFATRAKMAASPPLGRRTLNGSQTFESKANLFDLNVSEAGPETAGEHFQSEEIFRDPASFDFLAQLGSSSSRRDLAKESLYVKFDPLVGFTSNTTGDVPLPSSIKMQPNQADSNPATEEEQSEEPVPEPPKATESAPESATEEAEQSEPSPPPRTPLRTKTTALATDKLVSLSPALPASTPAATKVESSPSVSSTPAPGPSIKDASSRGQVVTQDELIKRLQEHQIVLEEQDKAYQDRIAELQRENEQMNKKIQDKTQGLNQLSVIMKEYEKTISRLVAEKEQEKRAHEEEKENLIKERDSVQGHLNNIEIAFADLHKKYERSKAMIEGFKKNEEVLNAAAAENQANLEKIQSMYDLLKSHAVQKLDTANQELVAIQQRHQQETAKLNATVKKLEIKAKSLEESLEQKAKENQALAQICDELINANN